MSSWETWDTYSELQMNVILINTPQIKFLGIRFLRITVKNQHSLAEFVVQNRQEIDLLNPEQGGTWAILNKTCFWVYSSHYVKEFHSPQEKHSDPTGYQRMSWGVLGVSIISLWENPSPGKRGINCGKFWKRWEYQTTWPVSWETCMQGRKQQLELDMEQQTGSK